MIGKFILYLATVALTVNFTNADILPSLVWQSENALLACKDPIVYMHYDDVLPLFCPFSGQYMKDGFAYGGRRKQEFNDIFAVENEEKMKACNITGSTRLLECNLHSERQYRSTFDPGNATWPVYLLSKNSTLVNFTKGATFYLINYPYERNDIGRLYNWRGSCNDTGNDFKLKKWKYRNTYKMRMKVHVCTDEEVASGKCKRCDYMECYYAGCDTNVTKWEKASSNKIFQTKDGKCHMVEERIYTDILAGRKFTDKRNVIVTCPEPDCSPWMNNDTSKIYYHSKCYREQIRICKRKTSEGFEEIQKREIEVQCPKKICSEKKQEFEKFYKISGECFVPVVRTCFLPWIEETVTERNISVLSDLDAHVAAAVAPKKVSKNKSLYVVITVISSILSLVFGYTISGFSLQYLHSKKTFSKEKASGKEDEKKTGRAKVGDATDNDCASGSDSPHYFFNEGVQQSSQSPENNQKRSATFLSRESSFNQYDTPQDTSTIPRKLKKHKVTREPSAASQTVLLRNISDASNFERYRESFGTGMVFKRERERLSSTSEENESEYINGDNK